MECSQPCDQLAQLNELDPLSVTVNSKVAEGIEEGVEDKEAVEEEEEEGRD